MSRRYKHPFDLKEYAERHRLWLAKNFHVEDGCIVLSKSRLSAKQRRTARENAAGPGWTKAEWDALVIKHDGKCLRCISDSNQLVPDHVMALVEGGKHSIDNIQPLCYRCNIWKGLKTIDFRWGYSLEVA